MLLCVFRSTEVSIQVFSYLLKLPAKFRCQFGIEILILLVWRLFTEYTSTYRQHVLLKSA